jgi:predicted nuclease of predicted toxin-antitoxin system
VKRCKVDEDLPAYITQRLNEAGFDAVSILDQNMQGTPDADVWEVVVKEKRWLITADKGFANITKYRVSDSSSIVLLRPQRESRANYLALIDMVILALQPVESRRRGIIVVEPGSMRIHRDDQADEDIDRQHEN